MCFVCAHAVFEKESQEVRDGAPPCDRAGGFRLCGIVGYVEFGVWGIYRVLCSRERWRLLGELRYKIFSTRMDVHVAA